MPQCCCNVTLGHVMYLWIMSFCYCVSCKSCVSIFHVTVLHVLQHCIAGPVSVCYMSLYCRSNVSVLHVIVLVAGPVSVFITSLWCMSFISVSNVYVLQVLCQCITCHCVAGPVSVCYLSLCCRSCVSVTCHCVASPMSVCLHVSVV